MSLDEPKMNQRGNLFLKFQGLFMYSKLILLKRSNKRFCLKVVSLLLTFSFLFSDILFAAPQESLGTLLGGVSSKTKETTLLSDPSLLQIPQESAILKEIHQGQKDKPFVIHIQDPHSNLQGQRNLAAILESLASTRKLSLILAEGSSKDATLTPIKELMPKDLCRKTAERFFIQGRLQGEEYLNLTQSYPLKIRGIEDLSLYLRCVKDYAKLAKNRQEVLAYLKNIQSSIEKLKNKHYPKELLDYEQCASERKIQKLLRRK